MRSMAAVRATGRARRASASPAARALARAGLTARGVLYILIGLVAIFADMTFKIIAGAGGNQPFGQVLLILAALGLVIFGVYGLCEARWRQV